MDGFNLYYSLRNTPCKWLDIKRLVQTLLEKRHDIVKIKYFTARVKSSPEDPSKPERQLAYWRALKSVSDIEIIEGCFKKREVRGRLLGPAEGIQKGSIVKIEKYEEKESDVNMASHIIWDSACQDIACVVLVSNDTDLKMPLRIARKEFRKRIGIISPMGAIMHQQLRRISQFKHEMTLDNLKRCQLPERIGTIRKPAGW